MNPTEATHEQWWRLSKRTWLAIAAGSAVSFACCLEPVILDNALWLCDYRFWPRWYFYELVIVFTFSIRWFWFYAAFKQGELDERRLARAKRFVILTGSIAIVLFFVTILDRFDLLRSWFGSFSPSVSAIFLTRP